MITVNGKQIQLTSEMSVADYLEQNNYQINRIAVEMNEEILPKYSYSETMLTDGDRLEVCLLYTSLWNNSIHLRN